MERGAQLALQTQAHVLHEGEVRKHGRYLERTDDASAGDLRRLFARDIVPVELDGARSGREKLGQ
ncbi:hypothetical protein D3C87_1571290 [compost metagenome]